VRFLGQLTRGVLVGALGTSLKDLDQLTRLVLDRLTQDEHCWLRLLGTSTPMGTLLRAWGCLK
jgi:hypothetical protein